MKNQICSFFVIATLCFIGWKLCSAFSRNLENNKLQGIPPLSLDRESLEVWYDTDNLVFSQAINSHVLMDQFLCRTSGNLCLSFSTMACNDVSSNLSIETPQVTIFTSRKHTPHRHLAIILGAAGGALFALILISLLVLLYIQKRKTEATYTTSM